MLDGGNVIVIVGPDFLGKSWLCDKLSRTMPESIIEKVPDAERADMRDLITWALRQTEVWVSLDHTIIYDRFPYPDEMVYRFLDASAVNAFETMMKRAKVKVVVVLPKNPAAYLLRLADSRDAHLLGRMPSIIENYETFLSRTTLDRQVVYVDDLVREVQLEGVKNWLATRQ